MMMISSSSNSSSIIIIYAPLWAKPAGWSHIYRYLHLYDSNLRVDTEPLSFFASYGPNLRVKVVPWSIVVHLYDPTAAGENCMKL